MKRYAFVLLIVMAGSSCLYGQPQAQARTPGPELDRTVYNAVINNNSAAAKNAFEAGASFPELWRNLWRKGMLRDVLNGMSEDMANALLDGNTRHLIKTATRLRTVRDQGSLLAKKKALWEGLPYLIKRKTLWSKDTLMKKRRRVRVR